MNPSVIVTRRWPPRVEAKLEASFNVTFNRDDRPMSADVLRAALTEFDAILPTVTDKLDQRIFAGLETKDVKTKIIANFGVGFSHIDVGHAERLGIQVTNTPGVLSECTADIAILLMLMAARRGGEGEREVRGGHWSGWCPTHMIGHKVSGATLGIVGFGRIGKETAQRANGFGMKVIVHNRSAVAKTELEKYQAVQVESLDKLLTDSDFVSLHCPGGKENVGLIGANEFALMKPNAFIVNTARGEVIEEAAMIEALSANKIAGAGLDVYQNEPAINPRLLELNNVVALPHLGSASATTRNEMGYCVIDNLTAFFAGSEPPNIVSTPNP